MNNIISSLLGKEELNAVVSATHGDIFSVLGMHQHPQVSGLIVRVFLPEALAVDVIDSKSNKKVASLTQVDASGVFEGKLGRRRNTFKYYLRVELQDTTVEMVDPYSFPSVLQEQDLYLFCEGTHEHVYQWMGAHEQQVNGIHGMLFVLWAPDATRVSVVGDFNHWNGCCHVMRKHLGAGVWEIFIPGVAGGAKYKFEIIAASGQLLPLKSDPYGFAAQHPPETASITVQADNYPWQDQTWMAARAAQANHYQGAVSVYEVHLGSWRRAQVDGDNTLNNDNKNNNRYLTYRELAEQLIPYVVEMGFSHLQLMPISEYPFDGSWGYQPIGLFSPTSRFGSPADFKYFVDCCHQQGIGLLLDWVPGHFPTDLHGTGKFDGTCLYEHEDVRKGFHPDWNTLIYNYGRKEVMSYLLSNAMYWFDEFHIDGLRVDAVASMLYLDYSREAGEWVPNEQGGRENLEAISLLQHINSRVYANYPGAMMVAEESTAWPGVSHPVDNGGLGFGFKWNMGWMNDSLRYMHRDPLYRQYHHNEMTFGLVYSFNENFVLPLSHDEVVHGKGSLLNKMPGDDWQQFANLRAYYGFMWTHPGKKLLFMGGEFAQRNEWDHDQSLDWHLLEHRQHQGMQSLIQGLNKTYRDNPALHQFDCDGQGFEWLMSANSQQSIFAYLRKGEAGTAPVLVVVNMTPNVYFDYCLGVPLAGRYQECMNTDSEYYGGSNVGNIGALTTLAQPLDGQPYQLSMTIPPLATLILQWQPLP